MRASLERVLTSRLACERLVPAHVPKLALLLGNPRVARTMFADGRPLSEAEVGEGLPVTVAHWIVHAGLPHMRQSSFRPRHW